ncbi:MAG: phytase esterase-like protein [Proteobacteria bacterium]|nr:MAG: phytase esterase-like protein [Pseudomonadota bacterium]
MTSKSSFFSIRQSALPIAISSLLLSASGTASEYILNEGITNFKEDGVSLPFEVLRGDIIDHKTGKPFQIRNGGYGSAMTAHPSVANQFYALTDRGPNAKYKTREFGKGKKFPTPDYTPRIGLFELQADGRVKQIKTILLRRPDGQKITGLPNSSGLGGTGETPYNENGAPILVNPNRTFDKNDNPVKLDDFGLDGEGLVALRDGSFWVSDEYGPHMVHFSADGREIERINAFANDIRSKIKLPAEFAHRRPNRGMEGLAITPDEQTLVGIMQSTMYLPNKKVKNQNITRIVTVNVKTGEIGQYLYAQEKPQNSNSEIVAINNHEFLVIERDGKFIKGGSKGKPAPDAQKRVYRIDLSSGTNIEQITNDGALVQDKNLGLTIDNKTLEQITLEQGWDALYKYGIKPVSKSLVIDMVERVQYPHDKMEGLWLINNKKLGILNDDDFATWSSGGKLEAKMLDANTIDSNRLYIVDVDLDK